MTETRRRERGMKERSAISLDIAWAVTKYPKNLYLRETLLFSSKVFLLLYVADLHLCVHHHWDKQSRHTLWPLQSGANSLPCKHQTRGFSVVFQTPKMAVTTSLAPPSLASLVLMLLLWVWLCSGNQKLRKPIEAISAGIDHQNMLSRDKNSLFFLPSPPHNDKVFGRLQS